MADERQCPECGSPLAEEGPASGLCPRCLIGEGLPSQTPTRTGGGAAPFEAPGPSELADRFPDLEVLELIGQGGMGAVYRARQRRLDRTVALKILSPGRVRDAAFAERFGREARTLARLSHPNIVGIHDFGEVEGLYYFVMEHVDGASLREVLREGRLSAEEALALVPQICEALQYAHEEGVVHRDIKPENVLLDRRGKVKIADFGLAKILEPRPAEDVSLTVSGALMGTPVYMAPEQIEKPLEVDHRADIYAVGVVFYEMLTGELPLGRFEPPSRKVEIDVRLDRVVLRALAKEPERRYQLASEVKTDVDRVREGAPLAAGSPALAEDRGGGPDEAAAPSTASEPETRAINITRPSGVGWVAAYSLVLAGCLALTASILTMLAESHLREPLERMSVDLEGIPAGAETLVLEGLAAFLFFWALWHTIVALGALRLKSWARYNMIILAVLELPALPFVTLGSILVLVYLFRRPVARIFELGSGEATLPSAEASALERFIHGPPLT